MRLTIRSAQEGEVHSKKIKSSATVQVFTIDAEIQSAFPTCFCDAASLQTGRLPKTGRLHLRIGSSLLEMWKASSEE